jgi:copper chaperone CopZ
MSAMMAAVLALVVGGESTVEVKVSVKGMSCEQNCGGKVSKSLQGLAGVKEVKLSDFQKGLFTVSVDAKAAIKPSEIKKAAGGYDVLRIEATICGTVSKEKEGFVLTSAAGAKYAVKAASKEECEKGLKEGEKAVCPIGAIEKLGADPKAVVAVTGLLDECCQGAVSISAVKVAEACKACDAKTGAN